MHDPKTIIAPSTFEDLVVESALTFVRQLVHVVARDEKRLRKKTVQWSDNLVKRQRERLYLENRGYD